jgi:hypothetical protein
MRMQLKYYSLDFQSIGMILFVCFAYKCEIVLYTKIFAVGLNLKISIIDWTSVDVHTWEKNMDSNEVKFIEELNKWHDKKKKNCCYPN